MTETQIIDWLCDLLKKGKSNPSVLKSIPIANSTGGATDLSGLIGDHGYEFFCDNSDWNNKKGLMNDVIQGKTPDIVIRSECSRQNRILVEAKTTAKLGDGIEDSKAVRYFLWLLGMTENAKYRPDIRRALLLAAPPRWFIDDRTARSWNYFLTTYKLLAKHPGFDITLGEIRCDELPSSDGVPVGRAFPATLP